MAQNRRLSAALTLTLTVGLACGFAPAAVAADGGEVAGEVFFDVDNDGTWDATENGLEGVAVTATDAAGVVRTASTGPDGGYSITGLDGTFTVRFAPADPDLVATAGPDSDAYPAPVTISAATGSDLTSVGFTAGALVNGIVFDDTDRDNTKGAGEGALGFDTVQALDPITGEVLDEVYAGADGTYSFTLMPDKSFIVKAFHEGYVVKGLPLTPVAGANPDLAIGLARMPGTITGVIWNDLNLNGVRDTGEPGVPGANVAAGPSDGTFAGTRLGTPVTTDTNGRYTITTPTWGRYGVSVAPPAGLVTFNGSQNFTVVEMTNTARSGTFDAGVAFDLPDMPNVQGWVWDDLDGDGIEQEGESGEVVAGAKVVIKDAAGKQVATPTLDEDGFFETDLPNGTYSIEFTAPSGYFTHVGEESAGASLMFTISDDDPFALITSGMVKAAGIDGSAWVDANGDGKRDAAEKALEGATFTVKLTGADGTEITTKSDAKGIFTFNDLRPGTYGVTMTAPAGYPNLVANTATGVVTLAPGERLALPTWIRPASAGGTQTGAGAAKTGTTGARTPAASTPNTGTPNTGTQAKATPTLAKTGSEVVSPLLTASGLIAAGFALISRRRRSV